MTKRMKVKNKHHIFHSSVNFCFEPHQYWLMSVCRSKSKSKNLRVLSCSSKVKALLVFIMFWFLTHWVWPVTSRYEKVKNVKSICRIIILLKYNIIFLTKYVKISVCNILLHSSAQNKTIRTYNYRVEHKNS